MITRENNKLKRRRRSGGWCRPLEPNTKQEGFTLESSSGIKEFANPDYGLFEENPHTSEYLRKVWSGGNDLSVQNLRFSKQISTNLRGEFPGFPYIPSGIEEECPNIPDTIADSGRLNSFPRRISDRGVLKSCGNGKRNSFRSLEAPDGIRNINRVKSYAIFLFFY